MIHFHDNDIILKLAGCDLLSRLPELLDVSAPTIHVLGTAKYKIRKLGKQNKYSEVTVRRALAFCEAHDDMPDSRDEAAFEELSAIPKGMDPGEALLFSVAVGHPGSKIVTGDKNAIRALASLGNTSRLIPMLKGSILCFEELLLRFESQNGFNTLRRHCCLGLENDKMLGLVFSQKAATAEEEAMQGIRSFRRALVSEAAGLLVERIDELDEGLRFEV